MGYKSYTDSAERFTFFNSPATETKECPVEGCYRTIPAKNSVCGGHWYRLSNVERDALAYWQPCLEDPEWRADPSQEYLDLLEKAMVRVSAKAKQLRDHAPGILPPKVRAQHGMKKYSATSWTPVTFERSVELG